MPTQASNKKDERSKSIASNPCGMCRAFGLPICLGHGGGSGSGEDKEEYSNKDKILTPKYEPATIKTKTLFLELENSEIWSLENDFQYQFNETLALCSIELDLASGLIHFRGKEFLAVNDKMDLDKLYDQIEVMLKQFTDAVNAPDIGITRSGNDLIIRIPDRNLYDQFVIALLNNNLIPNNNYKSGQAYQTNQNAEQIGESASAYKSPNPFDISRGPRPVNDIDG